MGCENSDFDTSPAFALEVFVRSLSLSLFSFETADEAGS